MEISGVSITSVSARFVIEIAGNPAEGARNQGEVVRVEYTRRDYMFVYLAWREEYPTCYELGGRSPTVWP